jgi:hypothetical protein
VLSRHQRHLAELRRRTARRSNADGCPGIAKVSSTTGFTRPRIEHVEQLAELANAAAGRPVDFQLADEDALQIGRRDWNRLVAPQVTAGPPRRSDRSDSPQLASPTLSITISTPPLLICRIAFDTRSVR